MYRHWEPEGSTCREGRGQPPLLHPESVSIFIYELGLSLSQAPENPRRWSSSAFKNGGKWKLDVCSDVCSWPWSPNTFTLMRKPEMQHHDASVITPQLKNLSDCCLTLNKANPPPPKASEDTPSPLTSLCLLPPLPLQPHPASCRSSDTCGALILGLCSLSLPAFNLSWKVSVAWKLVYLALLLDSPSAFFVINKWMNSFSKVLQALMFGD